jgi:hypothetical protein
MKNLIEFLLRSGDAKQAQAVKNGATNLYLSFDQLTSISVSELNKILTSSPSISSLELSNNDLGEEINTVHRLFKVNETIHRLNIDNCKIGPEGAKLIGNLIEQNNIIDELSISGNNIGPRGIVYIADVLKVNTTLKKLDLSNNAIGSNGIINILSILAENITIKHLCLNENGLTHIGDKAINHIFKSSLYITSIEGIFDLGIKNHLVENKQRVENIERIIKKAIKFYITGKHPLSSDESHEFLVEYAKFVENELASHSDWLNYKNKLLISKTIKSEKLISAIKDYNDQHYKKLYNIDFEHFESSSIESPETILKHKIPQKQNSKNIFLSLFSKKSEESAFDPFKDSENTPLIGEDTGV